MPLPVRFLDDVIRDQKIADLAALTEPPPGVHGMAFLDTGIRPWLGELNAISPDFVTVSSCTGHEALVVEGEKQHGRLRGHVCLWLSEPIYRRLRSVDLGPLLDSPVRSVDVVLRKFAGMSGEDDDRHIRPMLDISGWNQGIEFDFARDAVTSFLRDVCRSGSAET